MVQEAQKGNIIRARPCHLMKWNPCWVLPQPSIKQIPNRLSQTVREVTKTPGRTTGWYAQGFFPHSLGTPVTWGSWAGTSLESLLSCLKGQFRKSHFGIDCGCLPNYSRLLCLHTKQTNVYWNPFDFPYGHLDYTWPQPSSTVYQDLEFSTHKTLPSTLVRQSIAIRNCVYPDSLLWVSQNGVCASPPPHVTVQGKKSVCLHWWLMGW